MGYPNFGLFNADTASVTGSHGSTGIYAYGPEGKIKAPGGSATAWGNTFTNGDIISIAFDAGNGFLYFAKNGTWQDSGDPTSGASGTGSAFGSITGNYLTYTEGYNAGSAQVVVANYGSDSSFAGQKTDTRQSGR